MGRTFVMGDIHGAFRALKQCLEKASFDYLYDTLICLGDVADGWPETKQSIEELLKINNLVYIMGNHDVWTLEWMRTGLADDVWLTQGGSATVTSYHNGVPETHISFLQHAHPYYLSDDKLFVHAGFKPHLPIEVQPLNILAWDRELVRLALKNYSLGRSEGLTSYEEVYVGHTPTGYSKPIQSGEVWMMDTGAGWSGVLSMMDIDSKQVFTSDPVPGLYPGVKGRSKK